MFDVMDREKEGGWEAGKRGGRQEREWGGRDDKGGEGDKMADR